MKSYSRYIDKIVDYNYRHKKLWVDYFMKHLNDLNFIDYCRVNAMYDSVYGVSYDSDNDYEYAILSRQEALWSD